MSLRLNNGVTHQMGRDWFPPGNYQNQAMTIAVHATIATTPATFDYFVHMSLLTSGLPALGFWWGISNAAQMCAGTGTVKLMSNSGWAAFTSGAHKYVWTYDGTSATPTINAYLDNVVHNSSANNPTVGSLSGPWEFCNRTDAGGYRPADGTFHEFAVWNKVLSAQNLADYQSGVDARLIESANLVRLYRMVNGHWYDCISHQYVEFRAATVAFSSLTGTPARTHAAVQEHTGVPCSWFAEPTANTPVLRLPGPAIDTDGRTLCKRFRVGAITGTPQYGEKVYLGASTNRNSVFGFYLGVIPIGTNDNFIVLSNVVGTHTATTLTGIESLFTATASEVANCLSGLQGAMQEVTAAGGAGTFTFGETITQAGGATGRFAAETGGKVYMYGQTGTWDASGGITGGTSLATRTVSAEADYTPTVSRFTGTAWSYSTGTGTVTDVSPTSATDAAGPTTSGIPSWYTVTTSLVGFYEPSHSALVGNRVFEITDRTGNRNHRYASSINAMPSKASIEQPDPFDFIAYDQGRIGTQPTRTLALANTTSINRNALTVSGVFWRRNTRYAGSIFKVADVEVRTDADGKCLIRINGTDYTPSPTIYFPSRPFALVLRVNGDTKQLWIGSDTTSEATSFSNTTGSIQQVGSDVASLTNDDFFSEACFAVHSAALTDQQVATIRADLCAEFDLPTTWRGVLVIEGSSSAEGTGGELVNAGSTGNNQNRNISTYLLERERLADARVFVTGVFGHTFTNMDSRKTEVAAIFNAYPADPHELLSISAVNDIAAGTAPATVAATALTYHTAMRGLVPRLRIIMPTLFPRSYSGAYEANRLTFNAYAPGTVGADRRPDITDSVLGYFDASPDAVTDYTGAGFAGDGFHLSLAGFNGYAIEIEEDVEWGLTIVSVDGGGLRSFGGGSFRDLRARSLVR